MSYTITQTQFSTARVWLQLASILTDKDNILADTLLLPTFTDTRGQEATQYYESIFDKFVTADLFSLKETLFLAKESLSGEVSEMDDEHERYSVTPAKNPSKLHQVEAVYFALLNYLPTLY